RSFLLRAIDSQEQNTNNDEMDTNKDGMKIQFLCYQYVCNAIQYDLCYSIFLVLLCIVRHIIQPQNLIPILLPPPLDTKIPQPSSQPSLCVNQLLCIPRQSQSLRRNLH